MSKKKLKMGIGKIVWHHLRRSPFQSLAAVLTMWLNFLAAAILVVLVFGFSSLLTYFEGRPEVTAFLKDGTAEREVQELRGQVTELEGVKEVRFVSKEKALEIYREQNEDNPLLLEMVTADILPASLEISAVNPNYLAEIAAFLKQKTELVEEVVFQKDVVERLSFWARVIRNGGIVMVAFLSLVSLIIIMVIIGMKIAAHRNEIGILRSLGATNFYIQAPFLLEGMFYGFLGSLLGVLLVGGAVFYWRGQISGFFAPIPVIPQEIKPILFCVFGELAAGVFLGLSAAWLATRRYLRR